MGPGVIGSWSLEGNGLEELCIKGKTGLPYISGLLFYREAPLVLPLLQQTEEQGFTDERTLIVLDGNGILHPRRMGLACQIGVSSGNLTCGVAKKLMMGSVSEPTRYEDGLVHSLITDDGEEIGTAIHKDGYKPVYVSRGHRTDSRTVDKVISTLTWTRIPEPTRRAHELSNRFRRSETPS
jgi:deoxyribonuclease V